MALGISPERREQCRPSSHASSHSSTSASPPAWRALAQLWYTANGGNENTDWRQRASRHYDRSRYHLLNLHAAFSTGRPCTASDFARNGTLHAGEVASLSFAGHPALSLARKAASPAHPITDNPSTFRCWLCDLGFIGDEFRNRRTHLLKKRLPGNAAWRLGILTRSPP